MTKKIPIIFILTLIVFAIFNNCKKTIASSSPTFHVEWLKEYIKEEDLLTEEGKSLEDIASFHYQRFVIDRIRGEKTSYVESDIPKIISFIKNTKTNLKFNRIKDNLVLIHHLGFDSSSDIANGSQLWIKTKNSWKIFDNEDNVKSINYQNVYLGSIGNLQGEKLIVNGGCCDTDTLVIFDVLENGDFKNIYSNTLYGNSYSIEKEGDLYVIYEVTVEGEKTKIEF
ncbi:hypothetical protein [Leptospira kanakyensis]|uniref:hypothetical protein n=1 Tax=Leptospira kanakyensis TaxID=2484968 RepID=UPI00223D913B|nr:hypothetical protein [Leptospira kanakyensis]MCW7468846.1 hypothetical protein [Leptospira kanakyensis]MCW7479833.1 hypothetical protein [Leptospira kanakyensis]